ncbi:MAG: zinc-binding alcohol dehydrogenase [Planctomycetota bacterium]
MDDVTLPTPSDDEVLLEAVCTGISPGTERLVGLGRVPGALADEMACRGMQGTFSLPLLYGYSFVGRACHGKNKDRRAFVMRPHQQRAVASQSELTWLPDDLPAARATLFANLETARNAIWDAALLPTSNAIVIGAGAVGLLCAFVLSCDRPTGPGATIVERDPARRARAADLPWIEAAIAPEELPREHYDTAVHTTASQQGLQLAIDAVGFEGQVLELSWYGDTPVSLRLGGSFHSRRKRIVASQVGTIAAPHRAAGYAARRQVVLEMLQNRDLDQLLDAPIPFARAAEAFTSLYRGELTSPCPVFDHALGRPSA